jgi:hypothetical protein
MLPTKLEQLKKSIENQLFKDEDDKRTLQVLKLIEIDPNIQKLIKANDFLQKSFSAAPSICPVCGKTI